MVADALPFPVELLLELPVDAFLFPVELPSLELLLLELLDFACFVAVTT